MLEKVNKVEIKQIVSDMKSEMSLNKRTYLLNCIRQPNYGKVENIIYKDYINLEKEITKELKKRRSKYEEFLKVRKDAYSSDYIRCEYLAQVIGNGSIIPNDYIDLVNFYCKNHLYQKAYNICKKWFTGNIWAIPRLARYSLELMEKMEKAKSKKQVAKI